MRSGSKRTNWGSLGRLGVTQGHRQCHHSIECMDFLLDFSRNHASLLYRFRDIASYLSKVVDFNPPHLHFAPPVEFREDFWRQKTRIPVVLFV